MQRSIRRIAALSALTALALPLGGCAKVPGEEEEGEKAATVEKIGDDRPEQGHPARGGGRAARYRDDGDRLPARRAGERPLLGRDLRRRGPRLGLHHRRGALLRQAADHHRPHRGRHGRPERRARRSAPRSCPRAPRSSSASRTGSVSSNDPPHRRRQPQVPAPRADGRGRAADRRGRHPARHPARHVPRVHAAVGGDPDRGPRPLRGRDRAADHRAARGRPALRRGLAQDHALRVDPRPVVDPPDLRAGHQPAEGPPDGAGTAQPAGGHPQRVEAADDAVADVVDQPDDDDRPVVGHAVAHRHRRPGPVDDAAPPPRRARRGQRGHLGRPGPAAPGAGRPPAPEGRRRRAGPGRQHGRQLAVGLVALLPGGVEPRHRRLLRRPQSAPGRAARVADQHRRRTGQRAGRPRPTSRRRRRDPTVKPLRLGDVACVVEDHQPLIGDAIVNGKPGLMLVVEKLPTGNTLDVTTGVEEADRRAARPASPASTSTPACSGRPGSSTTPSTT